MKQIVTLIVLILLLSSIKEVFAPDVLPETQNRDGIQQTIKIFDRPEIDDIDFNNDLQVHKDGDDNSTVGFSELHKFANQLANTPGTRHIKKHSIELYKTYPLDSRPSNLPLLKEGTPIEHILNYNTTRDERHRARRKRRTDAKRHYEEESLCSEGPYWKTIPFFMAVSGWVLFFIVTGLNIHLKCRRCRTYKDDDIETGKSNFIHGARGDADNSIVSMTHTELQRYHNLSDRRHFIKQVTSEAEYSDLSHGIVYAVNVVIDDGGPSKEHRRSTEKRAVIRRHSSSVLRRHSLLEDIQFAKSVIMEENVDRQHERKVSENRKLIKRRSSADIGRFSEDTLSYAASVLSPSQQDKQRNKMASERRRVVREATSRERSDSLLDKIQFARSVILPSHQTRELDEDAAFRRALVKESHYGAGRRMSFTDDVIAAQEIISPEWRVRAESFESDRVSLNEVEDKASGSWGSL